MTKIIVISVLGALLAACNQTSESAYTTLSLVETDRSGEEVIKLIFGLTDHSISTCLNGDWKEARVLFEEGSYTEKPAYIWRNDQIEILLVNRFCDSYDSYIGNVTRGSFTGEHVRYGRGSGSTIESSTIGRVSGSYLPR